MGALWEGGLDCALPFVPIPLVARAVAQFSLSTRPRIVRHHYAVPCQYMARVTHALSFHRVRKGTVLLFSGRKDGRYRRCSVSQQRHRSLVLPEQLVLSG